MREKSKEIEKSALRYFPEEERHVAKLLNEQFNLKIAECAERVRHLMVAYGHSRESNSFIKAAKFIGNVFPESCRLLGLLLFHFLLSLTNSFLNMRYRLGQVPPRARAAFLQRSRAKRIIAPPGQKLLHLSELLFSPKTVTLTFKPLIADWQFEYFEALKAERGSWHMRIMRVRYTWHYAKACGLSKFARLFKALARS